MLEKMLICKNPACRYVLDLGESTKGASYSSKALKECPECGRSWLNRCPLCSEVLGITWKHHHAHCAACHQALRPEPPPMELHTA